MKLYATMMVYNEFPFLDYVSERILSFCNYIVIMDNGSTDGSREWLKQPHERVIPIFNQQAVPPNYSTLRNRMIDLVPDNAWIFSWDPDELPSDNMVRDLRCFLEVDQGRHVGWKIPIYHLMKSRTTCLPIDSGCCHLFLFKKTADIKYHNAIHEQVSLNGPCGTINPSTGIAIIHLSYFVEARLRRKALHYAGIANSKFTNQPEKLINRLNLPTIPLPNHITFQASGDWLEEIKQVR